MSPCNCDMISCLLFPKQNELCNGFELNVKRCFSSRSIQQRVPPVDNSPATLSALQFGRTTL
eukprot:5784156-Amphidinium_carterae.1